MASSNVEVILLGWDDVKARPIYGTRPKDIDIKGRKQNGKSKMQMNAKSSSRVSSSAKEKFKSSHLYTKLLAKSLQKWSESSGTGASMGLDDSCLIAVDAGRKREHRVNYSKWAIESFGFRAENDFSFLRCSNTRGKEILKVLRRTLNDHKRATSAKSNCADSPKRKRNTLDTQVTAAAEINTNKKKRWLSDYPRERYGKKQSRGIAGAKPRSSLSSSGGRGEKEPKDAVASESLNSESSLEEKQKLLPSKNLKIDREYSKAVAVVSPCYQSPTRQRLPVVNMAVDIQRQYKALATVSPCSDRSLSSEDSKLVSPCTLFPSDNGQNESDARGAEFEADCSFAGTIPSDASQEENGGQSRCNNRKCDRLSVGKNQEVMCKPSSEEDAESLKALAKEENEAAIERVRRELNEAHTKVIERLKSDLMSKHKTQVKNQIHELKSSFLKELEDCRIAGERRCKAEVECISNELDAARLQALEDMRVEKGRFEQQIEENQLAMSSLQNEKQQLNDQLIISERKCQQLSGHTELVVKQKEIHEAKICTLLEENNLFRKNLINLQLEKELLVKEKKQVENRAEKKFRKLKLEKDHELARQRENMELKIQQVSQKKDRSKSRKKNVHGQQTTCNLQHLNNLDKEATDEKNEFEENCGAPKKGNKKKQTHALPKKLVARIENDIVDYGDKVSFRDIAGLENAKRAIWEMVALPLKRPDLCTGLRTCPKGLLLFGPPGNGKTMIGKAIAHESGATFFSISSSSLTSVWLGEGELLVRTLFELASRRSPSVVFIDEVDSILTQRSEHEDEATRRLKTEFLLQFDGAGNMREGKVLVIGATNRPHELDDAARRRFCKKVYVPLPTQPARKTLLNNLLEKNNHNLTDEELTRLSQDTDGFSGDDLKNLCMDAARGPLRDLGAKVLSVNAKDLSPISYKHFSESLHGMSPSVNQADLATFVQWDADYGSKMPTHQTLL